ncbi:type I-E CRISPR-associated protein Cse1/CasA [Streptomyces sp. BE20]|uniref:type I-E CRISPR-associated protein Cse1/CasA n=1 Tax=Streptomyces sp. BE20 TaxID=3002525 RepID=UPI002E79D581|nr:type I-E CRISPR-associated protein Cse1/CasA [Streptomyces sp. BE20]MEE1823758.1 type I-E CRISPR-associated protein Cse1/CasA [Streptomyces sp. BE20]
MSAPASWSAAHRPWIDVLNNRGRHDVLPVSEVLERADEVRLAAADPLLRAATARLLTAIGYSAGCAPATDEEYLANVGAGLDVRPALAWTREHADDLDVLHPERPFLQDGALREVARHEQARLPVAYLDPAAAMGRPLLSDLRHPHVRTPVPLVRAFQWLLVQQMWAVGGRISVSAAHYGPGANYGRPAAATNGLVWYPAGTVAELLAWRLIPVAGGPGTGYWTFVARPDTGKGVAPLGELDGLTWHDRRVLLLPDTDGTVTQVMFAQGWRRPKDLTDQGEGRAARDAVPIACRPGTRDRVDTVSGKPLSPEAVQSGEDYAPLVERWWRAREGSWAHAAAAAAAAVGRAPDVTVAGLTVESHSKIVNQCDVTLPFALLSDARTHTAAARVLDCRRSAALVPDRRRDLGIEVPPGFGSDHLLDPAFLAAGADEQAELLLARLRPAAGADPGRDGRRLAALSTAVAPRSAAQPQREPTPATTQGARSDAPQPALFAVDGRGWVLAPEPPADVWDPLDDDSLFTTADTATPSPYPGPGDRGPGADGEDADEETDPAALLSQRLGVLANSPYERPAMASLIAWAARPQLDNPARPRITAGLPARLHEPAMLTAALFATHQRTSGSAPRYGHTPLPRLARAIGSGRTYGPAHPATATTMRLILRTRTPDALRLPLLALMRRAAGQGLTPHWSSLFEDLAAWPDGDQVRTRWSLLFHTAAPLPPRPGARADRPRTKETLPQ